MSLVTGNFRLKLLAIFLASTTWAVVVYAGNPPEAQTIRGITVEHGPPPVGLVPLNEIPKVDITIDGLRSSVASFRRESLHVSVDVTGAHVGSNRLPVRVESGDPTVTVRGIRPDVVDVELDHLGVAVRTVQVRAIGSPDACCRALTETATVVPGSVTLRGPESLLATAVAVAEVDVARHNADIQGQVVSVQAQGPDHRQLKSIASDPAQVAVSVPVHPIQSQRSVAVDPDLIGHVAPGFHVTGVQVNPPNVLLQGDPAILDLLQLVRTDPISIDGKSSDVLVSGVHLQLPAGITVVGSPGTITVRVSVGGDPRVDLTPSPAAPSPSPSPQPAPSPTPSPSPR